MASSNRSDGSDVANQHATRTFVHEPLLYLPISWKEVLPLEAIPDEKPCEYTRIDWQHMKTSSAVALVILSSLVTYAESLPADTDDNPIAQVSIGDDCRDFLKTLDNYKYAREARAVFKVEGTSFVSFKISENTNLEFVYRSKDGVLLHVWADASPPIRSKSNRAIIPLLGATLDGTGISIKIAGPKQEPDEVR